MAGIKGPDDNTSEKRHFISEKIVKPHMSKRQIIKRALLLICSAAIFGVIASLAGVITKPYAEKYLGTETVQESSSITIPKDEPETTLAAVTETETSEEATEEETEPIEDILQSALENYEYTIDDFNAVFGNLRTVTSEADKGIVTIHSVKQTVDWFDNPVETAGQYSGAVIAYAEDQIIIFTVDAAVEDADSIKVTFADGTEEDGTVRQIDTITGMAVVSVDAAGLDEQVINSFKVLELGNSYSVKQGDVLLAIGSPAGAVHSSNYGFVTYVVRSVSVPDGITRLIYTDLTADINGGTFVINTSGQIIGWVTGIFDTTDDAEIKKVMSISDYKSMLERMTNGNSIPYMGISGQEVTSDMLATGLEEGIYVVNALANGPAYNAGIQNGDIITKIGENSIKTMKDYQSALDKLNKDDVVKVTVKRFGRDEYKELEYDVTVGAR